MALAHLVVGLYGSAVGGLMLFTADRTLILERAPSSWEIWTMIACGMGAAMALFYGRDRMGQPGRKGFMKALFASLWISFTGSLIAGTLSLPFYGTMFGPMSLIVAFVGNPILGVLWFLNLIGAHILLSSYQSERNSIYERIDRLA